MTITLSRRTTTALAAVAALIVAAAITWALTSSDEPAAAANPGAPAASRTQAETTYLDQVKTTQAQLSDDEALRLGRDDCKGWDALQSSGSVDFLTGPGSLEQLAKDGKLTAGQVHGIEAAAVQYLCPANQAYYQSHVR